MMKKILIVDDEPLNLEILQLYLEDYDVQAFDSAVGCLAYLEAQLPDLVLMDSHMPEMSGLDACLMIRAKPEWQHLPLVMVSAFADQQHIDEALDNGFDDYLSKPFTEEALMSVVNRYLQSR